MLVATLAILMFQKSIIASQSTFLGGQPVFPTNAFLTQPIPNIVNTDGSFAKFGTQLRVLIRKSAKETNATQMTIMNETAIEKGDVLVARIKFRGAAIGQTKPARIEVLFEQATNPWTKSFSEGYSSQASETDWRNTQAIFKSAASYKKGKAMLSIRMALQPQRLEFAQIELVNLGKETASKTVESMKEEIINKTDFGTVTAKINPSVVLQTMEGLGGNFCQPRYYKTEPMDAVGEVCLRELQVKNTRIGIPLNEWNPERGKYVVKGSPEASMQAMARLKKLGVPLTASVWEPGRWLIGGKKEEVGRTLPKENYGICIESIVEYLKYAKKNYNVEPDFFSFNEPDYGVNFKFSSTEMIDFIKQCGPAFAKAGLKTKFLVADTANGSSFAAYAEPILKEASIAKYLGPLSFHSWDALTASETSYEAIRNLGAKYKKPVWCMEAGHDAQLWQKSNPWGSWENAIRTVVAYERTIRLTGASVMAYWTYQDNYTIVDPQSLKPYPVFRAIQWMETAFAPGAKVLATSTSLSDITCIATKQEKGNVVLATSAQGKAILKLQGLNKNRILKISQMTPGKSDPIVSETMDRKTNSNGEIEIPLSAQSITLVQEL
jgi:hypothetical protein